MQFEMCSSLAALVLVGSIVGCTPPSDAGNGWQRDSDALVAGQFELVDINVPSGATWQINRAIEFRFNASVDLASVNTNTVEIETLSGMPATGEYFLKPGDARTLVFQPRCPFTADLSDAGLMIGGTRYLARAVGTGGGAANTVQSSDGRQLANSLRSLFTTPVSSVPSVAFFDTRPGGPQALVRNLHSDDEATYVEFGGDPTQRAYFERDPATGVVMLVPNTDLPLNLLSDISTHIALVIVFNQAVDPSPSNVDSQHLRLEYRDVAGAWHAAASKVELASNCSGRGASVRVEPLGILPPATDLRGVVDAAFSDIVGETSLLPQLDFAPMHTQVAPDPLADEVLEEFASNENEDTTAAFVEPRALWAGDTLTASTGFTGTGGPGGDFDWQVPAGQILVFDTTFTTIVGGPGFNPTTQQACAGGIVQVRNLRIAAGAMLKVQGPNPLVIQAGGKVEILGVLDVGGTSSNGVVTLNTTNIPEPGAPGQAGGGSGGIGNPTFTAISLTGGPGQGPFGGVDLGGQGGETGWSAGAQEDHRRGAGGGGGRFGADTFNPTLGIGQFDQRRIGLDAEPGFDNLLGDNGALHPGQHPKGGAIGASPFVDGNASNDFYGKRYDASTQTIVTGELVHPWAGSGGGGGGNAVVAPGGVFPPPWTPGGDLKGAGGGGGAGALRIIALGAIEFGAAGQVRARGGNGGGGENSLFLNRVGGGSGAGAGGHVILESASRIDMHSSSVANLAIVATGGQGGAGAQDLGGAVLGVNGSMQTQPNQDACPPGYATTGANPCRGQVHGAGGDGGPGLIQLHTPTGRVANSIALGDIIVPPGLSLKEVCAPPPLNPSGSATGPYLLPSVSRLSRARSRWIALGDGGFDAQAALGVFKPAHFDFDGIDTTTGLVETTGGVVDVLAPIAGPLALQSAPALPRIEADGYTLTFDAAAFASANKYLLANDQLLRRSLIVLAQAGMPANRALFDVHAANYDAVTNTLAVVADGNGPALTSFMPGGGVEASLSLAFFRAGANHVLGALPPSTSIRIALQATTADASGAPDLGATSALTPDVSLLNTLASTNDLRFVRFEVLFDADAAHQGSSIDSPLPFLDFFKSMFRY